MIVKELIKILQQQDPETLVIVDGYEGEYDTPKKAINTFVCEKDSEWYYGDYTVCNPNESNCIKAIYLPR
jgi:hypothetical protein